MMNRLLIIFGILSAVPALSQEQEWEWEEETAEEVQLFHDTRVINGHSVETLEKRTLDFRITHRFGDAGTGASGRTLFGIDQAADIRIAFEYGILDQLTVGLGRSKGAAPYTEYWDAFAKYRIMRQGTKFPITMTALTGVFFTSMLPSSDVSSPVAFQKDAHRFSYVTQLLIGRGFADRVSLQLAPTWVHRNFVAAEDQNDVFSLGGVLKVRVYKKISLVAEYYLNFGDRSSGPLEYRDPLGFGIEFKTFAHAFQLCFMNSAGLGEGQFIPYTSSNWLDGQFRFGFTISRNFSL